MKILPAILTFLVALLGLTARADVVLLISNEGGMTITQYNATTNTKSTYFTGINHVDGLAYGIDGSLYATSYGTTQTDGLLARITGASSFVTIASGFNGSGALVQDLAGNFYVPNFGVPNGGTSLSKVAPNGVGGYTNSTLVTGLHTPDGVAFDSHGVLYEADFGSNSINKIDTAAQTVTPFVFGASADLHQPSALVFDSQDNLYVANYQTGTVSKISSTGTVTSNYATGLTNPLGLLLDAAHGTFYATSWTAGTVSSFASTGGAASVISTGYNAPTHLVVLTVPEPSAAGLALAGGALLGAYRRRSATAARSSGSPAS